MNTRKIARAGGLAIALAATMASCSWQEVVNGVSRTHHVVVDADNTSFDANPPDVIDVILTGPDQTAARCDQYGGRDLIWHPEHGGFLVCEDVDY